jgi:hypothetical protein
MSKKMTISQEAETIINGDRRKDYGDVRTSFSQTAKIWSGILNHDITPEQVALCMAGLKLQRESNSHKRDNLVDLIGYTLLLEKLEEIK